MKRFIFACLFSVSLLWFAPEARACGNQFFVVSGRVANANFVAVPTNNFFVVSGRVPVVQQNVAIQRTFGPLGRLRSEQIQKGNGVGAVQQINRGRR